MRLIDVLETRHQVAVKTAALRDYQALIASFEKLAADEKLAGPVTQFAGKAINWLKKPFVKGPGEVILQNASTQMYDALHAITQEVSKLKTTAPEFAKSLTEDPGQKLMAEMVRLRGALEKPPSPSKLPFLAMAGVTAAVGAGTTAAGMLDRRALKAVHEQNLASIDSDKNIPQNLHARAREMYGVLVTYAPMIAKDTVFSKDFVKNLVRHDTVDHKVIADLISAEKAYRESKGRKAEFLAALGDLTLKSTGWL